MQKKRARAAAAAARAAQRFGRGAPGGGGAGVMGGGAGPAGLSRAGGMSRQDMQGDPSYVAEDRVLTGLANTFLDGGGPGGYGQVNYGLDSNCPEGVNQNTALLATAAAIAVGAGVIYRAVTLQQAGRKRRKRKAERWNEKEDGVLEMLMSGIKRYRGD